MKDDKFKLFDSFEKNPFHVNFIKKLRKIKINILFLINNLKIIILNQGKQEVAMG